MVCYNGTMGIRDIIAPPRRVMWRAVCPECGKRVRLRVGDDGWTLLWGLHRNGDELCRSSYTEHTGDFEAVEMKARTLWTFLNGH